MDCVFCKIIKGEIPSRVLYEDDLVIVIMDNNPNVDGHALVIPKHHYEDFTELDTNIINHIYNVAKSLSKKMMDKLDAKSFTFLVNYGDSQVVKHFHLHLLPNFGDKELHRSIEENYAILKKD